MIRAQVIVRPRKSIFDPQGDAVQRAIQQLGVSAVKQAHVGKFIELELETNDLKGTRAKLEVICKDLLSNPVIEDYALTLDGPAPAAAKKIAKPAKAVKKTKARVAAKKPVKKAKAKAAKPKKTAKRPAAKASKSKKARKK